MRLTCFLSLYFTSVSEYLAINTLTNQLIDAGTLSVRGGGFIGRNVNIGKGGKLQVNPNEWTKVPVFGDDLRKAIVPYPIKEPSATLFTLLGLLIDSGKELSSMSDLLSGQNPPKDQPATTTMALIEQGLKVFSSVFKRIHKGLEDEFKKIERMNELFPPDVKDYKDVVDSEEADIIDLYPNRKDIVPVSDEADLTDVQKLLKAEALMAQRGQGYNDMEIGKRYFTALGIEDVDTLIPGETWQPPEDPAVVEQRRENDIKQQEVTIKKLMAVITGKKTDVMTKKMKTEMVKILSEAEEAGNKEGKSKDIGELEDRVKEVDAVFGEWDLIITQLMGELSEDNERDVGGMEGPPSDKGDILSPGDVDTSVPEQAGNI